MVWFLPLPVSSSVSVTTILEIPLSTVFFFFFFDSVERLQCMLREGRKRAEEVCSSTDGSGMEGSGTPTSPHSATGNGVTQVKKVRGVGFGDIFKEGSVKLKVRLPSPDVEEKKEKVSGRAPMMIALCMLNAMYWYSVVY